MEWINGMDVSTLLMLERAGAVYRDEQGRPRELFALMSENGVNWVRLRLWVSPYDVENRSYGAGGCDIACAVALSKRARAAGMKTLLCLHYSDFWADPGKQHTPKAWRGLNIGSLSATVEAYTASVLRLMQTAGVLPDMVQVGNEITAGLLWPLGKAPDFAAIARLTQAGARAVKQFDLPVLLHLDRGGDREGCVSWLERYFLAARGARSIDAIGLSYYPYWHGDLNALSDTLHALGERFSLPVLVVETAYAHSSEDYAAREGLPSNGRERLPLGMTMDRAVSYPFTPSGQADYLRALLQTLHAAPSARGFFWWEPAWLPLPGCGWAAKPALSYLGLPEDTPLGSEWANQTLFDYDGNALPAWGELRAQGKEETA